MSKISGGYARFRQSSNTPAVCAFGCGCDNLNTNVSSSVAVTDSRAANGARPVPGELWAVVRGDENCM